MPKEMANSFALRLGFYIFLDLLIFYHYRTQTKDAIKSLTQSVKLKHKHKIWTFLFIPVLAFILEFTSVIPRLFWGFITEPEKTINGIKEMLKIIQQTQ